MRRDEKGVSPVIGTILMVAITVILAAVIASFVFGMGTRLEPVKTPGFSVGRVASNNVSVVLTSMGGAQTIENCNVTGASWTVNPASGTDRWNIGEIGYINAPEGARIIVTCSVDGKTQVVLDTTV